jgi:hypothetical protein
MNLLLSIKKLIVALIGVMLLTSLAPTLGHTEVYVAGMGGFVAPMNLSDVSATTGSNSKESLNDVGLDNAAMAGAKLGYHFSSLKWLGIETEGLFTTIQFADQDSSEGNLTGADDLEVTTWGFNAVFRYPGEWIQPYIGGGLGLYFGEITLDGFGTATDSVVPGINALAGIRAFLNEGKSVAFFAEYKFNYAKFKFDYPATSTLESFQVEGTYLANIAAAGFAIHFDIFPESAL